MYWVEHVTRHQGAAYLQSAAQRLNWWQYHNVDVLLILFGVAIFALIGVPYAIFKLLRKILAGEKKIQGGKVKRN